MELELRLWQRKGKKTLKFVESLEDPKESRSDLLTR